MTARRIFACLLLGLAGCRSPEISAPNLVGQWRYADATQSCRYDFKRDGSFSGELILHGRPFSKFRGTWSVAGDVLNYRYTADSLGRISPGSTDRDRLLRVQASDFVIRAADGSERKYVRFR